MPNSNEFLGKPVTKDYVPSAYLSGWYYTSRLAPFTLYTINNMLIDSRICFGLWLIKGPILANARFFIKTENSEVKEYIKDMLTRFWITSAVKALKSVEWGYSCSEALWAYEDKRIVFKGLKDLHPMDCRPVTLDGSLVGATVRNVPTPRGGVNKKITLYGPKAFWCIHGRESHPWFGRSRLYGAYQSWTEAWTDGGYRDSRRLFFHKYAFDGGTIYHPPGNTRLSNSDGSVAQEISNKDLARELVEKRKTGGSLTLPNIIVDGQRMWEYQSPEVAQAPSSIMEYGQDLKQEILEGMGIPPEVAQAEGTGAYAGRAVPMEAFYAILQEIMLNLIMDADNQLFRPAVRINFGDDVKYEIQPFKLSPPSTDSGRMNDTQGQDGGNPGMEMSAKPSSGRELIQVVYDEPS